MDATALNLEIEEWDKFERILYKDDQALFDRMMTETKQYLKSFEASNDKHPTEALFMALIFQQQKMITKLLSAIEAKSSKLNQ